MEKNTHRVNTIAKFTIIENILPKKTKACHAIHFTYPLEVDIIFHIFSVIIGKILSESEFCIHCTSPSFRKEGIRSAHSIYQGTHNWVSDDWSFSNQDINDCNNSVHRLKKNGTNIINHAKTNKVAMIYVINIQTHLLLVILCQKIIHHSKAKEMMKAAITIYMYDNDMYIIYHNITITNHINQNFNISLVVLEDWADTSSGLSIRKWYAGFSSFGCGKRFQYLSFISSFRHWKTWEIFRFFSSKFCFNFFNIRIIGKM